MMDVYGKHFFTQPHNFRLMLNVDCFQLYEHTQYSVGVVYLAIIGQSAFFLENVQNGIDRLKRKQVELLLNMILVYDTAS